MCGQTVIPRFTVQFGEKKCSEYRGNSKSGTININLHIRLLFGGEKNELGISGKTVYRGTTVIGYYVFIRFFYNFGASNNHVYVCGCKVAG